MFSNQRWWRNLRGGGPVVLRLRGRRVRGWAEVIKDTPAVVAGAREYLARRGPGAARRINVRLPGGRTDDQALADAMSAQVVVRIALQPQVDEGARVGWPRGYDLLVRLAFAGREARVRAELLDRLELRPGERVLDVGCGTGTLAVAAARRVGRDGWVGGVDAAPQMVQAARRKAAREGVGVDVREALAQDLPFPDGSVDAVMTSMAMHHVPPHARVVAVAEMRRVLRPGGRLLIADFQPLRSSGARAVAQHVLGHRMAGVDLHALADLAVAAGDQELDRGTTSVRWLGWVLTGKPAGVAS